MIAQANSATVEMALLEPNKAQQPNSLAQKKPIESEKSGEFQLFGNDGLTFWDFLDIVNPLQHIPIISTLYRAITGDEIDPAAKIAGGTLYGGPLGAASSLFDVAIEYGTGRDIGEHAMAFVRNEPSGTETVSHTAGRSPTDAPGNTPSNTLGNPSSNPYLVRAGISENPVTVSSFAAPSTILAQEMGQTPPYLALIGKSKGAAQNAGMSGIPIARLSYADQISKFAAAAPKQPKNTAEPAPGLGLLSDIKHLEKAGIIARQKQNRAVRPADEKPLDLTPKFSAHKNAATVNSNINPEVNARLKKAEAAYQKLAASNNNWLANSILKGMDGLDKLTPDSTSQGPSLPASPH